MKKYKLNPNAQKWVDALRSGQYKQTRRRLYDMCQDAYCCLGVACEVARQWGSSDNLELTRDGESYVVEGSSLTCDKALPHEVAVWLGLRSNFGLLSSKMPIPDELLAQLSAQLPATDAVFADSLTCINDSRAWSFDQIADLLETYPELFFRLDTLIPIVDDTVPA